MKALEVDWEDLEIAFRDVSDSRNFFDRESGKVVSIFPQLRDESILNEVKEFPERFIEIKAVKRSFTYDVLTEFAEKYAPQNVRDAIEHAMKSGEGLRESIRILENDQSLKQKFQRLEQSALWRHIESFLKMLNIQPLDPPRQVELFPH